MNWKQFTPKNVFILVFGAVLFYCCLQNPQLILSSAGFVTGIILPFALGFAIAFIFNVPMKKIEAGLTRHTRLRKKLRRPAAYLLTLTAVIGVLLLAFFVVIPELTATIMSLMDQIPKGLDNLLLLLDDTNIAWPEIETFMAQLELDWNNLGQKLLGALQTGAFGVVQSTFSIVGGIVSGFATFFIGFTFSVYLLFQKEALIRQCKKLVYAFLPTAAADRLVYIGGLSATVFSNFLAGQCTEAVILGMMFFVSMLALRMPYALLVGVLIAITALIPIFGAFIGCVVGFFLIVVVNPMQALVFLILFQVLQQIEGNLIYPHVVGGTVGLPSVWVLAAVSVGGSLMGIVGMLLFIPGCSVCYALLREQVGKRLEKRQIPSEKWTGEEAVSQKAGSSQNTGADK